MATLSLLTPEPASDPARSGDAARGHALVDAAYQVLEEEGLEGLTIRSVLKRSGLARRAFYERFGGKDDLVLAVFEQTLRAAAAHFRKLAEAQAKPAERIRVIVAGIVLGRLGLAGDGEVAASDRRSAALAREHVRLAEARPEDLQRALSPLLNLIAEIVADGIAAGAFRPCDPALQARLIYNAVSTTVHTELLGSDPARPDPARRHRLASEIAEFCLRAIIA